MPGPRGQDTADGNGWPAGASERAPLLRRRVVPTHRPQSAIARLLWHRRDTRVWVRWPASALHLTWATISSNYVNILLVFVPLGIVSGISGWNPTATFVLNFFAIIPLASLLSFATEELAATMGETLGGLLNATFGNAVELIVRSPPSAPKSCRNVPKLGVAS